MDLFAASDALLYHYENNHFVLHAMPVMIFVLVCLALAYRYYSAFLAAKVAVLDDSRETPAHRFNDGQNYHPTNKWVLFGHHFAAISGAGPLIGPVLAIQYGYAPGLLWLVIGVCLAGAVQDMLVLAASVRSDGKSLAEIARRELGPAASVIASLAILFIVIIALAGLGFVVVKALGGEEVKLPKGMKIYVPAEQQIVIEADWQTKTHITWELPPGCSVQYTPNSARSLRPESFRIKAPLAPNGEEIQQAAFTFKPTEPTNYAAMEIHVRFRGTILRTTAEHVMYRLPEATTITLPAGCSQVVPGSSWGTFTIAATIPIALLTGLWMYRIRPGKVVEASIIGGTLVLAAVVAGNWIPGSFLEPIFSLTRDQTIAALVSYGFIAAVLPVWLLLGPRDYLSSFLKIGTIALLVVSVIVANPSLNAPPLNEVFISGGPTFPGAIFPFVFICIMCGAISGFHALVSSGTTPKMVDKESHVRTIGYGSMLIEGLVGTVALIAAATLPSDLYYPINVSIADTPVWQEKLDRVEKDYGLRPAANDPLHATNVDSPQHLDLGKVEEKVGGESLRGRTGGAVTLAVGMAVIFEQAFQKIGMTADWLLKYWYHFAIMFEALFILTTIDAGTRIARFLVQETAGRIYKPFARPDWLPGALIASALVTGGWGWLIYTGSIDTIWPMFGIANQVLSVMALTLVTTRLINNGRAKYAPLTILPLLFVMSTTLTATTTMVGTRFPALIKKGEEAIKTGIPEEVKSGNQDVLKGWFCIVMTVFVVSCVIALVFWAVAKWLAVLMRKPTNDAGSWA